MSPTQTVHIMCSKCQTWCCVSSDLAGKRIRCQACAAIVDVPLPTAIAEIGTELLVPVALPSAEPILAAEKKLPPPLDPIMSPPAPPVVDGVKAMWHYVDRQQTFGPVSLEYLEQRVKSGLLTPTDRVWCEGMVEWVVAATVRELFPRGKSGPPPLRRAEEQMPSTVARPTEPWPAQSPQRANAALVRYRAADFSDLYMKFMLKYLTVAAINLIFGLVVAVEPELVQNHLLAYILASLSGAILLTVLSSIFLYRAWAQIQDGAARTTPGKAIGYRFIPFFNFYWEFVAVKGLAEDIEHYADARRIAIAPISQNLTLSYCILMIAAGVLSAVPFLGTLLLIPVAVLLLLLFKKIADNSAAIAEAKQTAAPVAGLARDDTVGNAEAIVTAVTAGLTAVEKFIDKGHDVSSGV